MTRWATGKRVTNRPLLRRFIPAAILFAAVLPGCASARSMMAFRQVDPMAGAPKLQNVSNPHIDDLVSHLNRNVDRIQSWRANSVRIQAANWSLSGRLAVEKDRHVRLVVTSPLGNEVDMGSNDERFWVWSRRMEPAFVTCRHENTEAARQTLGIPFEPEWLMQALGVSSIPTTGVKMEVDLADQKARLIQQVTSAHGKPLRRVVLVDIKKGKGVIVEHALYDYFGKPLALAKLKDHRLDRESGVVLPHKVSLDWPEQQMHMSMDLGKIQVNPSSIPSQLWDMPEFPGFQVVELDAELPATRISAAVQMGPIETAEEEEFAQDLDLIDREENPSHAVAAGHSRIQDDEDEEPKKSADANDSKKTKSTDNDWSE